MFYGEEDSTFQSLPPEMIVEVLGLVDLEEKQSARLVCRRWRWILDHPDARLLCFKQISGKMTENSIQYLLKSQLQIDHLALKDIKVTWPSMTYSRNQFPHIRNLTLESGNSGQSMTTLLQYGCAQTESLTLDNFCLSLVGLDLLSRVLSGMRWNQLTQLVLKVTPDYDDRVEFYPPVNIPKNLQRNNVERIELIFEKARIPNLRVLGVTATSLFGKTTGIVKLMSSFMIFLEHHSKTLKELRLRLNLSPLLHPMLQSSSTLISTNISDPLFPAEQQESVARNLKLECLEISTTYLDALRHLVPPCILESENLTKLSWRPQWADHWLNLNPISTAKPGLMAPPETANPIQSLINRNRNTLTNVTTGFILGDIGVDPFQLHWLQSCPQLRELAFKNWFGLHKIFSLELQFPTMRRLEIDFIKNFESIENMSAWISRTFPNLGVLLFTVCFTNVVVQNWEFGWIQNLLLLPRLGEIRFLFQYWYEESRYQFTGPNLIRQYCSDKGRLMFRGGKKCQKYGRGLRFESCLIKILPTQNYDLN